MFRVDSPSCLTVFLVIVLHSGQSRVPVDAASPTEFQSYLRYRSTLQDYRLTFRTESRDEVGERVSPIRKTDWEVLNWTGRMFIVRVLQGSNDWVQEDIYRKDELLSLGTSDADDRIAEAVDSLDLRAQQKGGPQPLGRHEAWGLFFGVIPKDLRKEGGPLFLEEIARSGGDSQIDRDNPTRIVVDMITSDYRLSMGLRQDYGYAAESITIVNRTPRKEFKECTEVQMTAEEFKQFDGKWFPTRLQSIARYKAGRIPQLQSMTGEAQVSTTRQIVDAVDFGVDFSPEDFEPTINIQDGTFVNVESAPNLRFKWMDGRVVPATDQEAMDHAMEAVFERERAAEETLQPSYRWVLYLGVTCIAMALAFRLVASLRKAAP